MRSHYRLMANVVDKWQRKNDDVTNFFFKIIIYATNVINVL